MTRFEGGPAAGQVLELARAPFYLRVTVGPGGKVDALDQLGDEPRDDEAIFAYQRVGPAGRVHLYFGGGKGAWLMTAEYVMVEEQPTDDEARYAWRVWCEDRWKGVRV